MTKRKRRARPDLGLRPLYSDSPGERERELRLAAQQQAFGSTADRLVVDAVCRQCGRKQRCVAWLPGLNDFHRMVHVGDRLVEGRRPPNRGDERLDLVDGLIQGSVFCGACWTRHLARWDVRKRDIVAASLIPPMTGLAPSRETLQGDVGCPHCGADTPVETWAPWRPMAERPPERMITVTDPGARWEVRQLTPVAWVQQGTLYTFYSRCAQCGHHIGLAWRIHEGQLVAVISLWWTKRRRRARTG